jgi:pSer/pThr/pTyr-binding forkhead associated (FHA) protein
MASPVFQLQSVGELQARLDAERTGRPFMLFRDGDGHQQLVVLPDDGSEVPIGRGPDRGLRLGWDPEVSRVHAVLGPVGGAWTIVDDGLSSNGTFVNGARVMGRRRLDDGDAVACGSVMLQFRNPESASQPATVRVRRDATDPSGLSPAQRRVLVALCRPLRDTPYGSPATNKDIAAELNLSVDAVKTHLRNVAGLLGVDQLPQNQKRAQLAWKALSSGVVTPRELLFDE